MARAHIQVNGTFTSTVNVPIGVPVLLSNDDEGGESTYAWTIVDQPAGSADALSNPLIENPSFTPTKEGTYLLRLVVNLGLGTEAIDLCKIGILDARTGELLPAAAETTEDDTIRGWAKKMNLILGRTLVSSIEGAIIAAVTPGGIAAGSIVNLAGLGVVNGGMQFPHELPTLIAASGSAAAVHGKLGVVLDGVAPGVLSAGKVVLVRVEGIAPLTVVESGATIGDPVYVSDTAMPSLTPGTFTREIGRVIAATGTTFRWLVIDGGLLQQVADEVVDISPFNGIWETMSDMILQPGYVESANFVVYNLAIPLSEGDRLKSITFARFGNGAADISAGSINKFDANGTNTPLTITGIPVTNPGAAWADTVLAVTSPAALPSGSGIWLQLVLNAAGIKLGTFRIRKDHPV